MGGGGADTKGGEGEGEDIKRKEGEGVWVEGAGG